MSPQPGVIEVLTLIFGSILPILIYKSRTRSEIVLQQKTPFIIKLSISLNRLHVKIITYSAVLLVKTQEEMQAEFFNGLQELINEIRDNQAEAKLYFHVTTCGYVDDFVKTSFELLHSKKMHEWMLAQGDRAFSGEDLNKEYARWSKILPNKLKSLVAEQIIPSLRRELNGYWSNILLERHLAD